MENNNQNENETPADSVEKENGGREQKEAQLVKKTHLMHTLFQKTKSKEATQKIKTKIKSCAKNAGLLLVTLIILFLLLEIIVRVTEPPMPPIPKRTMLIEHSTHNPFLIFGPSFLQADRQLKSDKQGSEAFAIWNHQGFRVPNDIPYETPEDEYRIFAMGGSTTEDMANNQNVHYCGVAEDLFGSIRVFENKRPRCINAGSSGYSTAHALVRLQFDILNFKPQMITVMQVFNDLTVSYFPYNPDEPKLNYGNKYFHPALTAETNLKQLLLHKSKAWRMLQKRWNNIRTKLFAQKIIGKDGKTIYSTMRFTNESASLMTRLFYNNLRSIVAIAKEHDITVVLMTEPAVFTDEKIALLFGHEEYNKDIFYPPKEQLQTDFEVYNAVVRMVAQEEDVYVIDMYNLMGHDEEYFVDAAHYSAEGSRRFGQIYAAELRKIMEEEEKKQRIQVKQKEQTPSYNQFVEDLRQRINRQIEESDAPRNVTINATFEILK